MSRITEFQGSYRNKRLPEALQSGYFLLDDRQRDDLIRESARLASQIRYYNEKNKIDGHWEAFFEDIYDYAADKVKTDALEQLEKAAAVPPHLALYLAFLHVFKIAQDELNRFTERHLEYYYRNILKFEKKKESPDRALLFFELKKKESLAIIPKDTLLDGGNDNNGKKRLYSTDFDLLVSKAKVVQVKSLTKEAVRDKDNPKVWNYTTQEDVLQSDISQPARIGFAISSPLFHLSDGERIIQIKLKLSDSSKLEKIIPHLDVEYTSPTGWTTVGVKTTDSQLEITLDRTSPSMIGYEEGIHQMHLSAIDPVIRFSCRKNSPIGSDDINLAISKEEIIGIKVNVTGSKGYDIKGDYGIINNQIPFLPFGPNPSQGDSSFSLGGQHIFNKYLTRFKTNIQWKGNHDNLVGYYSSYKPGWDLLDDNQKKLHWKFGDCWINNSEKIQDEFRIDLLQKGLWKPLEKVEDDAYHVSDLDEHDYPVRVVSLYDYGQDIFTTLLGKVILYNTQHVTNAQDSKSNALTLPEKPYIPEIQELSIDYELQDIKCAGCRLFSIHPFSNAELTNQPVERKSNDATNERHYYIALSGIQANVENNIYFEIDNSNPSSDDVQSEWLYYVGGQWQELPKMQIVKDTTERFNQSGIVTIAVPKDALQDESDSKVWLCLRFTSQMATLPRLLNVRTNAVTATFKDEGNELSHLKLGVPKDTITKLVERNPKILSVEQPRASEGGREAESDVDYRIRVSERLRHKNRASTAWDYERLMLDRFPQIAFALCLPHCKKDAEGIRSEYAPGNILLLVSPDTGLIKPENPLEPKVPALLLNEMKKYLKKLASAHVNIDVQNISYRAVKVECKVQLRPGHTDIDFYRDKLNHDLKYFIAPWQDDNGAGHKINLSYKSKNVADIYYFLEGLEYIGFVVSAVIKVKDHSVTDGWKEYRISDRTLEKGDLEMFTSVEEHDITIVNNG